MFGHLLASLKVEIQEGAVGAAHHIGGGDHQQRQNGGTAGDGILFEQVPNLFNERGAAITVPDMAARVPPTARPPMAPSMALLLYSIIFSEVKITHSKPCSV